MTICLEAFRLYWELSYYIFINHITKKLMRLHYNVLAEDIATKSTILSGYIFAKVVLPVPAYAAIIINLFLFLGLIFFVMLFYHFIAKDSVLQHYPLPITHYIIKIF